MFRGFNAVKKRRKGAGETNYSSGTRPRSRHVAMQVTLSPVSLFVMDVRQINMSLSLQMREFISFSIYRLSFSLNLT